MKKHIFMFRFAYARSTGMIEIEAGSKDEAEKIFLTKKPSAYAWNINQIT